MSRRGTWSSDEDQKLIELVESTQPVKWVRISASMGTRSSKQCRERYHNYLKPSLNRQRITEEEGHLIEKLVNVHGKRWAEISRHLVGRSDNAIKNWWNANTNRRRYSNSHIQSSPESSVSRNAPIYGYANQYPAQHQTQSQNTAHYYRPISPPAVAVAFKSAYNEDDGSGKHFSDASPPLPSYWEAKAFSGAPTGQNTGPMRRRFNSDFSHEPYRKPSIDDSLSLSQYSLSSCHTSPASRRSSLNIAPSPISIGPPCMSGMTGGTHSNSRLPGLPYLLPGHTNPPPHPSKPASLERLSIANLVSPTEDAAGEK